VTIIVHQCKVGAQPTPIQLAHLKQQSCVGVKAPTGVSKHPQKDLQTTSLMLAVLHKSTLLKSEQNNKYEQ